LDLLNLDLDPENGGSALTVGKYVADGLFVSATQDVRGENGAVRIEYEITNNITVESELQQNGDQTVSANWKRDF
ncbi:MAG: translocation/assembly module TamB domain-containing protein, partial [Pseudomonadota bacterium]